MKSSQVDLKLQWLLAITCIETGQIAFSYASSGLIFTIFVWCVGMLTFANQLAPNGVYLGLMGIRRLWYTGTDSICDIKQWNMTYLQWCAEHSSENNSPSQVQQPFALKSSGDPLHICCFCPFAVTKHNLKVNVLVPIFQIYGFVWLGGSVSKFIYSVVLKFLICTSIPLHFRGIYIDFTTFTAFVTFQLQFLNKKHNPELNHVVL